MRTLNHMARLATVDHHVHRAHTAAAFSALPKQAFEELRRRPESRIGSRLRTNAGGGDDQQRTTE